MQGFEVDRADDHVGDVEAEVGAARALKAAEQEQGRDQEHGGDGHLADDQDSHESRPLTATDPAVFPDQAGEVGAHRLEGRRQAEGQGAEHRQEEGEEGDAPVDDGLQADGQVRDEDGEEALEL